VSLVEETVLASCLFDFLSERLVFDGEEVKANVPLSQHENHSDAIYVSFEVDE
jgi:hypothetical protein